MVICDVMLAALCSHETMQHVRMNSVSGAVEDAGPNRLGKTSAITI